MLLVWWLNKNILYVLNGKFKNRMKVIEEVILIMSVVRAWGSRVNFVRKRYEKEKIRILTITVYSVFIFHNFVTFTSLSSKSLRT